MLTMQVEEKPPGGSVYEACTTQVGKRSRLDYWTAVFGSVWGDVDVFATGETEFYGALRSIPIGSLRLNRISFEGLGFRRSSEQARRLEAPFYSLAFPVGGSSIACIDTNSTRLQPGHIFLLDNSRPARLVAPKGYETLNIQIPYCEVRERLDARKCGTVIQLDSGSAGAAVLRNFATVLYERNRPLDERSSIFLERQLCDLVAFCFSGSDGIHSADSGLLAVHRERAARCIEKSYAREQLSPQSIAAACGISVSYLHKLYRDTGRSLMEHVREVRLDAADRLLKRPSARTTTVSEIAYSVGFKSLSDFSRAYKRRFGRAPTKSRD